MGGQRQPEGGRAKRGAVPAAPRREEPEPGGRQAGLGLQERPVWSPRTRGGGMGIPSRTARPGQLPDAAGTGPAARPPPRAALRSGSEQATYRAARRKWLEFLPRRRARASRRAGRGGRSRDRAQALRGAGEGCAGSQPGAPAGTSPLGALFYSLPASRIPADFPVQPPGSLTCFWLTSFGVRHLWSSPATLLIRRQALSLWDGAHHAQHLRAPA